MVNNVAKFLSMLKKVVNFVLRAVERSILIFLFAVIEKG